MTTTRPAWATPTRPRAPFTRTCATIIVGCLSALPLVVGAGNAAADPPGGTGDTWVDCPGPSICTKYYSRQKTRDINAQWGSVNLVPTILASGACGLVAGGVGSLVGTPAAGAAAGAMAATACGAAVNANDPSQPISSAASAAATANGCLQVAWNKDQTGTSTWAWTNYPGYCWDR